MNKYELMFIINPVLDDSAKEAEIENVKSIIAAEGEVTATDVWGLKKLAYPIEKVTEGYYVVMTFNAQPTLPKELDRKLRISDNCLRHIIVAKDEK